MEARYLHKLAYIALGSIAILVGAILFLIVMYQFLTVRPLLYDRIAMMALFGWAIYLGGKGIVRGKKI